MQPKSTAEIRRWKREPVVIPVNLVLKADNQKSDSYAATTDVSVSGMGVRTTLALVPRQEVTIVMEGEFCRTIPARVIWMREDKSSNSTIAGLKFL
jgi:hypothetical protein